MPGEFAQEVETAAGRWQAIWTFVNGRLDQRLVRPKQLKRADEILDLPASLIEFEHFVGATPASTVRKLLGTSISKTGFDWRWGVYVLMDDVSSACWYGIPGDETRRDDPEVVQFFSPSLDQLTPPPPRPLNQELSGFILTQLVICASTRHGISQLDHVSEEDLEQLTSEADAVIQFGQRVTIYEFADFTAFRVPALEYEDLSSTQLHVLGWREQARQSLPTWLRQN